MDNLKQPLQTLILENGETIEKVSSDFKYLATRHDRKVKFWSLSNLDQPLQKLNLGDFSSFIISKDFKYISSYYGFKFKQDSSLLKNMQKTSEDNGIPSKPQENKLNTVKIWSIRTEELLNVLEDMDRISYFISALKDTDNENGYFINRKRREIVNPETGKVYHFQASSGSDESFEVDSIDINQEHQLAVLGTRNAIRIHHLGDGKLVRTIPSPPSNYNRVQISPNGEFLSLFFGGSTGKNPDNTTWSDADLKSGIEIFNLKKGESLFKLPLDPRSKYLNFFNAEDLNFRAQTAAIAILSDS